MNLRPIKQHEPVTILMVPMDQYSVFPAAVDAVLKETRLPFEFVIVEGGAPEPIRLKLQRRQKHHKHMKIIYSAHRPRMAEAFNLGLPHIRTRVAFLMNNNVRVTPLWLEHLLERAKENPGLVCPYITDHEPMVKEKDLSEVDMSGFLVTQETLRSLGEFDEKVSVPLLGLDLAQKCKKSGVVIHRDPLTVLEYKSALFPKSTDLKFFQHQWNEKHVRESVSHIHHKWGLKLNESKYLGWVQKRKHFLQKNPSEGPSNKVEVPLHLQSPKIGLRRFLQMLAKA